MSDNYYVCLEIIDRISHEALKKYITYSKFSQACGYPKSWWYKVIDSGCSITYQTLNKVAEALNLSVEYLITGKDRGEFKKDTSLAYIGKLKLRRGEESMYAIRSRLRKNLQHDVHLTTLFHLADITGLSVMNILRGDINE